MGAPYGTGAMRVPYGTNGHRKDVPEQIENSSVVDAVLFPTPARFLSKQKCRIITFFFLPLGKGKLYHQFFTLEIDFSFYINLNFISVVMRPVCNFLCSEYLQKKLEQVGSYGRYVLSVICFHFCSEQNSMWTLFKGAAMSRLGSVQQAAPKHCITGY